VLTTVPKELSPATQKLIAPYISTILTLLAVVS
jgi:hypothetical protein